MTHDPILALRLSTLAISGLALTNRLNKDDAEDLLARAELHLPEDSEFRLAIRSFVLGYRTNRFDRQHLEDLGKDLWGALRRECLPTAPDAHRVDIHG